MPSKETLLPILVSTFAELGYRRATTSVLAQRCQAQETTLYRIWPDKKAMFVDAIDYVTENNLRTYRDVLARPESAADPAGALLAYESGHVGEFHNYRIIFSALPEDGDPEIQQALQRAYHRIHAFLVEVLAKHVDTPGLDAGKTAWGLMGLGTIMTILDELGVMAGDEREAVFKHVGALILRHEDSDH